MREIDRHLGTNSARFLGESPSLKTRNIIIATICAEHQEAENVR
jgi:hypothetical protein